MHGQLVCFCNILEQFFEMIYFVCVCVLYNKWLHDLQIVYLQILVWCTFKYFHLDIHELELNWDAVSSIRNSVIIQNRENFIWSEMEDSNTYCQDKLVLNF